MEVISNSAGRIGKVGKGVEIGMGADDIEPVPFVAERIWDKSI